MTVLILFYIGLLFVSILIFRNTYVMWKINRDFTLPISIFFIYYFTLIGAVIFPIDSHTGFQGATLGLHYVPIFKKIFMVYFDNDYILSCFYYVLFILVFQYTYLFIIKKYVHSNRIIHTQNQKSPFELSINPYFILLLSLTCIGVSCYILRREIYYAIAHEKSIYSITRATKSPYYTVHQLANEFSVLIPFIAYAFTTIKVNMFNSKTSDKRSTFYILLFTCLLASCYIALLGNRREILSGIVICTLMCVNQFKNIRYGRLAGIVLMCFVLFLGNDFFRSQVIPRKLNAMLHLETRDLSLKDEEFDLKGIASSLLFSNELFYAHFSMYGVIHKNVPITYGSSFISLAASAIPRSIYPDRPPDIYTYYAKSVEAKPGQLYTIHHAAAWYLNFGIIGILIGAMLLALVFAFATYFNLHTLKNDNTFWILAKYLMPFLVCAQMATFITAGPEGYKSLMLEGIVLPILFLKICFNKTISANMHD